MIKFCSILLLICLTSCGKSLPKVKGPISLYFIESTDSSLELSEGEYILHLIGTNANILAFSGSPIEKTGDRSFDSFKKDFTFKDFNGAFIVNHEATMLKLSMPVYNSGTQEMTLVVKPIGTINTELMGKQLGRATLIVEPEKTEQVKKIE